MTTKTKLKSTGNKVKDVRLHFWRENMMANHFILTKDELVKQFSEWLPKQKANWLRYYGWNIATLVQCFVAQKDGMNSVGQTENDQYDRMYSMLKEIRDNYFNEHKLWD